MGALDGKVVLVTGGGNGIGRDCALIAAQEGAKVLVNDLGGGLKGEDEGSAGPAEKVAMEIRAAGGQAAFNSDSVTNYKAVEGMVEQAMDVFGGLHAVINPAGILRDVMFHKMSEEDWDRVIDVHMRGSFNVARATIELFREQNDGAYMFFTSTSGLFGNIGQANYGAAKMGLVGLAHVLAQEGERYNIKANAISPIAGTRMTREIFGDLTEKLDPALVSPVVTWLAHEDCPVSGHTYSVGGGRVARVFVGQGPGYMRTDAPLTVEDVRDHFDEIERTDDFTIFKNATDELRMVASQLR
jgi:NAD(P)-dependent dehydrogenase (short-subunit alcohol dehydrogenase family)